MACTSAFLLPLAAGAHEARPVYVQIDETAPGELLVQWRVPTAMPLEAMPEIVLPPRCTPTSDRTVLQQPGGWLNRRRYTLDGTLAGNDIGIRYPDYNPSLSTLYRVELQSGLKAHHISGPAETTWTLPGSSSWTHAARSYMRLGIQHILEGIDHLLFVLGLLLIVRNRWMLLKAITSFTVAHSITLGVATLGYAHVPIPPLNAAIALSILYIGVEDEALRRGKTSVTIRHAWLAAFAFGLLHGFGFASGLNTTGIPSAELPVALLFFNVGVEIGQIGFVLAVLVLQRSFEALYIRWPRWAIALPGYAVGTFGAYWTIQRTAMLLGII